VKAGAALVFVLSAAAAAQRFFGERADILGRIGGENGAVFLITFSVSLFLILCRCTNSANSTQMQVAENKRLPTNLLDFFAFVAGAKNAPRGALGCSTPELA